MNLPKNQTIPPRGLSGKLAKPELLQVRRQLRAAAIDGDTAAALALSNYELIDLLKRQSKPRRKAGNNAPDAGKICDSCCN